MSEYVTGNVRLGMTTSSLQEPGLLGEEFSVIPALLDSKNDVLTNTSNTKVTLKWLRNSGTTAIGRGLIVKADTAAGANMLYDVVVAGANDPGVAVVDPLVSSVPAGHKFLGIVRGEVEMLNGGVALTKGLSLKSGAAGVAVADAFATVADYVSCVGRALEAAAIGARFRAYVDFRPIA